MSFQDDMFDRRSAFVERWHARQTQQTQNLAEHHYFVARIAMDIVYALAHYDINMDIDMSEVVSTALLHDEAEKITGDVPGSAKRIFPELRQMVEGLEDKVVGELYGHIPGEAGEEYTALVRGYNNNQKRIENQIVKYADKLEAWLFARTEVKMGNSLMYHVLEEIGVELMKLEWPWLVALRKEVGLP